MGRNYARATLAPEVAAYRIVMACEPSSLTEHVDAPGMMLMLREQANKISSGDLSHAESALSSQATALQILFARLTEKAMAEQKLANLEVLLRLALRAQAQARATLETLGQLRLPVVYSRQTNLAVGPLQVNNNLMAEESTRARKERTQQNELLEDGHEKWMDSGAQSQAGRADTSMEAMGVLDRPHKRSRQSGRGRQRP